MATSARSAASPKNRLRFYSSTAPQAKPVKQKASVQDRKGEKQLRKQLAPIIKNEHATSCENIEKCEALHCIVIILHHYQMMSPVFCAQLLRQIESESRPFILDFYHHILHSHSDQQHLRNVHKELISIHRRCETVNYQCSQQRRRRRRDVSSTLQPSMVNADEKTDVPMDVAMDTESYVDLIDTIHCNIVHFAMCADESGSILRPLLPNDDVMHASEHNKYFTQISAKEKPNAGAAEAKQTQNEANSPGTNSTISFDFGYKYYYWDHYKYNEYFDDGPNAGYKVNEWYIPRKYTNLKYELLMTSKLEANVLSNAITKATQYLQASIAKSMKSNGVALSEHCQIKAGSPIAVDNLLSIILYTDFTQLSANLTLTFRRIPSDKSLESMKQRNGEYWHWSKTLIETVQLYGTLMQNSTENIFYHGISYMTFPSFLAHFCAPTSTTIDKTVAMNFCADNSGLILELVKENEFSLLRYFDVSWLSAYSYESERLFVWGNRPLKFHSIELVQNHENCYHYITALTLFDYALSGRKLTNHDKQQKIYTSFHGKIIYHLMEHHDPSTAFRNKFHPYANDTFVAFVYCKKEIKIHFHALNDDYPFIKKSITSDSNRNLLLFDKFARVFTNCTTITVFPDPAGRMGHILNQSYLDELRQILTDINSKSDSISLQKIVINDAKYNNGTSIKCLNKEFSKKYLVQFPQCKLKIDFKTHNNKIIRSDLIISRSKTLQKSAKNQLRGLSVNVPFPGLLLSETSDISKDQSSERRDSMSFTAADLRMLSMPKSRASFSLSASKTQHTVIGHHQISLTEEDEQAATSRRARMELKLSPILESMSQDVIEHAAVTPVVSDDESYDIDLKMAESSDLLQDIGDDENEHDEVGVAIDKVNEIWLQSCRKQTSTKELFSDLYAHLLTIFRSLTECENRWPTKEQLEILYVAFIQDANEQAMSPHRFDDYYLWFVSMCHIIKDFKRIYDDMEKDTMMPLYFTAEQSEQALSKQKADTFLLRLGTRKNNELFLSYKAKDGGIQDICFVRVDDEIYMLEKTKRQKHLFSLIRGLAKLRHFYCKECVVSKNIYFSM